MAEDTPQPHSMAASIGSKVARILFSLSLIAVERFADLHVGREVRPGAAWI
jgi:hypothetical protein